MSTTFFYPPPHYTTKLFLPTRSSRSLKDWCSLAEIPCRASGSWVERKICVKKAPLFKIFAEASPHTSVLIESPTTTKPQEQARLVLSVLAYSLMDPVARESIKGAKWNTISTRGRKPTGKARTNGERQRAYRERWK